MQLYILNFKKKHLHITVGLEDVSHFREIKLNFKFSKPFSLILIHIFKSEAMLLLNLPLSFHFAE